MGSELIRIGFLQTKCYVQRTSKRKGGRKEGRYFRPQRNLMRCTNRTPFPSLSKFILFAPPLHLQTYTHSSHVNAIVFLISAMALPGFNPLGHVREQLRMVWHLYRLMLLSSISFLSALCSSRESASQRYDCRSTAGPRYSSLFHQYEGQDVEQQAQRMHS